MVQIFTESLQVIVKMNSLIKLVTVSIFIILLTVNLSEVHGNPPDAESIEEALRYLRELDEKYSYSARPR